MAKRGAQKQLTMDNFDQEDDDDSTGADTGPQLATAEILKTRQIAKPKRRSDLNSPATDETKRSAFSGFGGFKGFATNTSQNPSFNAFKAMNKMETNDNTFKTTVPSTQTNGGKPIGNPRADSTEEMTTDDSEDLYNNKLSELNKSFFQHINSYMSRSEFFDFTQVCKEYIEYHQKIETETKSDAFTSSKSQTIPSSSLTLTQSSSSASYLTPQTMFGSQSTLSSQLTAAPPSQSSNVLFSTQTSSSSNEESSVFVKPTIQFGLSANKPITGTTDTTVVEESTTEESDEPPKVESIEHKEPDSVYSKKCKLFFKKGEEWSNKGVGYLYIKKEESASSAQLLIRADNKLGNILLHISLTDSLPISRAPQNKGIYLSCIPNPPLDPKATTQSSVTFLIKVKSEDTEQLFDNLVKFKTNQ